jgi:lipopolysaccharide/colanic/teichoic acid biosynthesis glycosyltransferase
MYKKIGKRLVDLFISIVVFIIFLPIFIITCIILLLTGEHEVLYLQKRVGFLNNRFKIWKFASMLKKSPEIGTGSLTVRKDARVLPFGRFLRASKINELPQIVNVLLGDMSIVGPRPQMEVDFYKFSDEIQKVIYSTKPGITGIGSIIFRDEERLFSEVKGDLHVFYAEHIAPYKGELEVWYLKKISFWTDIQLIFLTFWVIIFKESNLPYILFSDLPKKPRELR